MDQSYIFKIYISLEMDTVTRVQIMDVVDGISHSTNTLDKGINQTNLSPAMGKLGG